jgi:hypothetical protein
MTLRVWQLALVLGIGTTVGLGTARSMLGETLPFQKVEIGPWTVWPRIGGKDIDPYARAILARLPHLPMGTGEGLVFMAERDEAGRPLTSRCIVDVAGRMPSSRGWTLSLADTDGRTLISNTVRAAFTDAELTFAEDGQFAITAAREAQSGNWLPVGEGLRYKLILRVYDTPISGTAAELRPTDMPTIKARDCR